jgi:hypothetical protein
MSKANEMTSPGTRGSEVERVIIAQPWCDLKIAFSIDDQDAVWSAELDLPDDWELFETDFTGAGAGVAVFRISGNLPCERECTYVAQQLAAL